MMNLNGDGTDGSIKGPPFLINVDIFCSMQSEGSSSGSIPGGILEVWLTRLVGHLIIMIYLPYNGHAD